MIQRRGNKKQAMSLDAFRTGSTTTPTTAPLQQCVAPRKMWGSAAAAANPAPSIKLEDIARQQEMEEKALTAARDAARIKAIEEARLAEIKRQEWAEQENQRLIDEAKQWEEERPQREALAKQQEEERLQRQREAEERFEQESKERAEKERALHRHAKLAATRKQKNGLKKLLQMTPEMQEYLDQFEGTVEFSWSRNRSGEHQLDFEMEDTLTCHADLEFGGDFYDGTRMCDLDVDHATVASPILADNLDRLASNLFFGSSTTSSVDRRLLIKIGEHLVQTDSADACLPTASLATRTAVDDWIDARVAARAAAQQRSEESKKRTGFGGWAVPLFDPDLAELDVFRTFLATHKKSFRDDLSEQIDTAQKAVEIADQVHAHVDGINTNLDRDHADGCAAATQSTKRKCNCRTRLTQDRFNHWDGLVGLSSIPLAILLVLLGRSGDNPNDYNSDYFF